jgi:hypothetical protein
MKPEQYKVGVISAVAVLVEVVIVVVLVVSVAITVMIKVCSHPNWLKSPKF